MEVEWVHRGEQGICWWLDPFSDTSAGAKVVESLGFV